MLTIAARIRAAVAAHAQAIRRSNGYATDMGLRVLRGVSPLTLSAADLEGGPVLVIGADPDRQETGVLRAGEKQQNTLHLIATALQLTGDDVPQDVADVLLADIKRALLMDPQEGVRDADATLLGGAVEYTGSRYELPGPGESIVIVEMMLTCRYAETYGRPDTTRP